MALIGYGAGGLLLADSLANTTTAGHFWQVELLLATILLLGGAVAHLARGLN